MVAVSGKGERAEHFQACRHRTVSDIAGALGMHPGPVMAAVDLDEHTRARQVLCQLPGACRRIHGQEHLGLIHDPAKSLRLALGDPERIGDEQIGDARRREHLGFADGGDGQPDRSTRDLTVGEFGALVGLGVRAQRKTRSGGELGHSCEVGVENGVVDGEKRGVQGCGGSEHPVVGA